MTKSLEIHSLTHIFSDRCISPGGYEQGDILLYFSDDL